MKKFLQKNKYEILLFALIQHLYIGIFLTDMPFYTKYIWPLNMLVLGVASIGVFIEKGKVKNIIKNILFFLVIAFPLSISLFNFDGIFMLTLNISMCLFYAFIFIEVLRFLIKPSYINRDIITASICGYFLLIEMSTFMFQAFFYNNPMSFKGMDYELSINNAAKVYMDLVYFCSITITSIGYGDILPNTHYTKLISSFIGVIGQFYSVVLVGILISKFTNNNK